MRVLARAFLGRRVLWLIWLMALVQVSMAVVATTWTVPIRLGLLATTLALLLVVHLRERQRVHERRVLLELGQAVTSRSDLGDLMDRCVQAAAALVPAADTCVIYLLDPSGRRLNLRYVSDSQHGEVTGVDAGSGLAAAVLQHLQTLQVDDARLDPDARSLSSDGRLRSLLVAPLHMGQERLGLLCLGSALRGLFTPQDRTLATLLAGQAASALYRHRLEAVVRQERQQSGLVLDSLTDALMVLDHASYIIQHNPALTTVLGPDLSGLVGSKVQVQSADPRLQRLAYLIGDCAKETPTRRSITIEEPVHAVLEIDVNPITDEAGRCMRVVVIHDVTPISDALAEQTRLLRAVAHGMQAPLAVLAATDEPVARSPIARQLERLRQDLLVLTEPMEALALDNEAPVPLRAVLDRLPIELPPESAHALEVRIHDRLAMERVRGRWIGHLLGHLIQEIWARTHSQIVLDVEGQPKELVFTVRAPEGVVTGAWLDEGVDLLGFGANQGALAMLVSRRLAEALGGYLWTRPDGGAPRCQVILPLSKHRQR